MTTTVGQNGRGKRMGLIELAGAPLRPSPARASSEKLRPVVVIPTYNEAGNVARIVGRLLDLLPGGEVLIVDDNSPDGTADIVRAHPEFARRVHLLARPGKQGIGRAYTAGFAWALSRGYDRVVQMDADFSHAPEDVPRLLAATAGPEGADVAIGSRYVRGGCVTGWNRWRLLLSRSANLYARTMLGVPVRDLTGGFKCWRASALAAIGPETLSAGGYVFQCESTLRTLQNGGRVVELPITFREREIGASKMGLHIAGEGLLWVALKWWSGASASSRPAAGPAGAAVSPLAALSPARG